MKQRHQYVLNSLLLSYYPLFKEIKTYFIQALFKIDQDYKNFISSMTGYIEFKSCHTHHRRKNYLLLHYYRAIYINKKGDKYE